MCTMYTTCCVFRKRNYTLAVSCSWKVQYTHLPPRQGAQASQCAFLLGLQIDGPHWLAIHTIAKKHGGVVTFSLSSATKALTTVY